MSLGTIIQKQVRLLLESQARRLAEGCPAGVGFALMIFDFGEGGNMAYVSNAERADMIRALEELLQKLKQDRSG
jgi:hypothetical protein